ncbi:hypothetical protein Nepgr_022848 [Nepenthes gracilis]|uniref:Uncharacterized protein n=1 Tax=Nepenthes gracilis TaxID=150966 RepID=A0AAD3T3B6_NEPGR|nr:hypothetical protein Nepgr_022848 [Nepenthes gracilis]
MPDHHSPISEAAAESIYRRDRGHDLGSPLRHPRHSPTESSGGSTTTSHKIMAATLVLPTSSYALSRAELSITVSGSVTRECKSS